MWERMTSKTLANISVFHFEQDRTHWSRHCQNINHLHTKNYYNILMCLNCLCLAIVYLVTRVANLTLRKTDNKSSWTWRRIQNEHDLQ